MKILCYFLPAIPFFTRSVLFFRYKPLMLIKLDTTEQDRTAHRSHIQFLAGFSFSALIAIVILDTTLDNNFQLSIYYLFISFLGYMAALNIQGYKIFRWQDHLVTALVDSASLCLILSVVTILITENFNRTLAYFLTFIAMVIWIGDHYLRICFQSEFLKSKQGGNQNE